VPFSPDTCFLLKLLHASRGESALSFASFAIAVTHLLNGVPGVPATCFLLKP
jgi:hypothetical protein